MPGRFIDWVRGLTAKSTTIDGTEQVHLDSAGLSQKALLSDVIRYGGGNTTRITTIGNANIHQSNTGAMWLEVTGGTNLSGNNRGQGAFDWQAVRANATRVASGELATAFGENCTASGAWSVAIGALNVASGIASVALGRAAASTNFGQFSYGVSGSSTPGTGQANVQTFFTSTADASATVLSVDGQATNRMVIPAMRACAITGLVTAMSDATDGYKVKAWEIKCIITRDNSNNTRIVGTPIITELGADTEAASWAITSITADNTNESLSINVTGEAATNIRWQASLFYSQVGR